MCHQEVSPWHLSRYLGKPLKNCFFRFQIFDFKFQIFNFRFSARFRLIIDKEHHSGLQIFFQPNRPKNGENGFFRFFELPKNPSSKIKGVGFWNFHSLLWNDTQLISASFSSIWPKLRAPESHDSKKTWFLALFEFFVNYIFRTQIFGFLAKNDSAHYAPI